MIAARIDNHIEKELLERLKKVRPTVGTVVKYLMYVNSAPSRVYPGRGVEGYLII